MKQVFTVLSLIMVMLLVFGCNKDDSEVDQLEQEVMEAENRDLMPDSSEMVAEDTTGGEYTMAEETAPEEADLTSYEQTQYGGFTVQVAAGMDRTRAQYTAEIYTERGYQPFVNEAMVNDTLFYRIRIGNFDTIEKARELAAELSDKYSVKVWIDRN